MKLATLIEELTDHLDKYGDMEVFIGIDRRETPAVCMTVEDGEFLAIENEDYAKEVVAALQDAIDRDDGTLSDEFLDELRMRQEKKEAH